MTSRRYPCELVITDSSQPEPSLPDDRWLGYGLFRLEIDQSEGTIRLGTWSGNGWAYFTAGATSVDWPDIGGDQSAVDVSGFNNDAGYLTSWSWTLEAGGTKAGVNQSDTVKLSAGVGISITAAAGLERSFAIDPSAPLTWTSAQDFAASTSGDEVLSLSGGGALTGEQFSSGTFGDIIRTDHLGFDYLAVGDIEGNWLGTIFYGTASDYIVNIGSGWYTNGATGSGQGAGTFNVTGLYIDGKPVATKHVPVASKSSNFTLTNETVGDLVKVTGSRTITISSGASVGDQYVVVNDGSGTLTFSAGSGVTINSVAGSSPQIDTQYAAATAVCVASNTWIIFGNLV